MRRTQTAWACAHSAASCPLDGSMATPSHASRPPSAQAHRRRSSQPPPSTRRSHRRVASPSVPALLLLLAGAVLCHVHTTLGELDLCPDAVGTCAKADRTRGARVTYYPAGSTRGQWHEATFRVKELQEVSVSDTGHLNIVKAGSVFHTCSEEPGLDTANTDAAEVRCSVGPVDVVGAGVYLTTRLEVVNQLSQLIVAGEPIVLDAGVALRSVRVMGWTPESPDNLFRIVTYVSWHIPGASDPWELAEAGVSEWPDVKPGIDATVAEGGATVALTADHVVNVGVQFPGHAFVCSDSTPGARSLASCWSGYANDVSITDQAALSVLGVWTTELPETVAITTAWTNVTAAMSMDTVVSVTPGYLTAANVDMELMSIATLSVLGLVILCCCGLCCVKCRRRGEHGSGRFDPSYDEPHAKRGGCCKSVRDVFCCCCGRDKDAVTALPRGRDHDELSRASSKRSHGSKRGVHGHYSHGPQMGGSWSDAPQAEMQSGRVVAIHVKDGRGKHHSELAWNEGSDDGHGGGSAHGHARGGHEAADSDSDSITPPPVGDPDADGRIACAICGRKFAKDRIGKHQAVCARNEARKSKRGQFDASKQRKAEDDEEEGGGGGSDDDDGGVTMEALSGSGRGSTRRHGHGRSHRHSRHSSGGSSKHSIGRAGHAVRASGRVSRRNGSDRDSPAQYGMGSVNVEATAAAAGGPGSEGMASPSLGDDEDVDILDEKHSFAKFSESRGPRSTREREGQWPGTHQRVGSGRSGGNPSSRDLV